MNEITVFFQKWQLDERGVRERMYLAPQPTGGRTLVHPLASDGFLTKLYQSQGGIYMDAHISYAGFTLV
jgi:hypothetical protein